MKKVDTKKIISGTWETGSEEARCHFCGKPGDRICLWCDSACRAKWCAKTVRGNIGVMRSRGKFGDEQKIKEYWFNYYQLDFNEFTDDEKEMWNENFIKHYYSATTGIEGPKENII